MERSITHNGRTGFGSLTPGGLNLDNFPMKLFTKGNGKVWNPADINFTQDAVDFAAMSPDEQRLTMVLAAHFIGGEESGGFGFGMHLPERDGIYADLLLLDVFMREHGLRVK